MTRGEKGSAARRAEGKRRCKLVLFALTVQEEEERDN